LKSDILGHTGVHYEIFVRAFCDTNHDGLGDLNGVTAKLDYLQDLGITAIWLMPINSSPSYHKYDVTDYYSIDRDYGTLDDLRRLIAEAHQRGIRVIMDFVINHTSSQHPWFREAIKGPDNPYWNWYVWMKPVAIKALLLETRAITADSQERNPWHAVPGAPYNDKYYALFWNGMPDLNFDHPPVREAIYAAGRYWLEEVGVDGFRLDAARHIYPEWEEPKNHAFWQEFREKMETIKHDVYLVGEVWTRPLHIAPYFRGLKANFNFDLRLSIEQIVRNEDDTEEIISFLAEAQGAFGQVNPNFIDALILSNHDQNRIGSLLNGHPDRLKVAANLLLTLPGNPYLYYGEEIGMLGLKPDENIREPFLWNIGKSGRRTDDPDRARWRKARYSTSRTVKPLAQQQTESDSLFCHYRRLIQYRNNHPVLNDNLSRLEQCNIRQKGIVAFIRRGTNGQRILIVHNLSHTPTTVVLPPDEQAGFGHLTYQSVDSTALLPEGLMLGAYSVAVMEA